MHVHAAFALAILAHAARAQPSRFGYEREIDGTQYNQVPKLLQYVLNEDYLLSQKDRAKLITKPLPEDPVAADNVIVESNVLQLLKPGRTRVRRGYNLEHVNVPAAYPYLPYPSYQRTTRFRRRPYNQGFGSYY